MQDESLTVERIRPHWVFLPIIKPTKGVIVVPVIPARFVEVGSAHRGVTEGALFLFFFGVFRCAHSKRSDHYPNADQNCESSNKSNHIDTLEACARIPQRHATQFV